MRPTVYIETAIPSYYVSTRSGIEREIARTREWWDNERVDYEPFISAVVYDELSEGDYDAKGDPLRLVADLRVLQVTELALEVARVYTSRKLMPSKPFRDALHVAVASVFRLDYLLTLELSAHRQREQIRPLRAHQRGTRIARSCHYNTRLAPTRGGLMSGDKPDLVEEIRERALRISERYDHDLQRYAEHLREVERDLADRVVDQITVVKLRSSTSSDRSP